MLSWLFWCVPAGVFTLFGAWGLYLGIRDLRRRNRSTQWLPASGVVVGFKAGSSGSGKYRTSYRHPIVDFSGPAGTVRFVSGYNCSNLGSEDYVEGQEVRVLFEPANPQDAEIDSSEFRSPVGPWLKIAVGGGCSCTGIALFVVVAVSAVATVLRLVR